MKKIIFLDADGVIVAARQKYFSQRLSEDFSIDPNLVIPLFKNEFYKCVLGELDLKEVLIKYLPQWGWKGSVDELLAYWWQGENKLNTEIIDVIQKLRAKGTKCYLATDQEKYRANYLWNDVGLKNYLDGAFFSCDLHVNKSTKEYWQKILEILENPNSGEVIFYDDEQENIDAAKEIGIQAHFFKSADEIKIS